MLPVSKWRVESTSEILYINQYTKGMKTIHNNNDDDEKKLICIRVLLSKRRRAQHNTAQNERERFNERFMYNLFEYMVK